MHPVHRRVLARVLMAVLSLVLVTGTIVASQPASAAPGSTAPLAVVADQALAALGQRAQAQQAVVARRLLPSDPELFGADARYAGLRRSVAALAGPRAGLDPLTLDAVWTRTGDQRMVAVLAALSQVGVPYRRNRSQPGVGFDCSGLTTYAWATAGVSLPRNSSAQISSVAPRPLDQAQPGDLVQYPGHVMMALGLGTAIVHASHYGVPVEVRAWSRARRAGSPVS